MFWITIAIMLLVALAIVLPPLLRKMEGIEDDRREQNISIAKMQLAELEQEYKEGRIEKIAYESSKAELEQALYDDLQDTEENRDSKSALSKNTVIIAVGLFVPIMAVGLYAALGTPEALHESSLLRGADLNMKHDQQVAMIDKMVGSLEAKLQKEPNNLKGWIMLGRSYTVLNRPADAVKAYEFANKLDVNNPAVLLPLADSIATTKQGDLRGRPEELIQQALEVDPKNIMGLWLAGMAAKQRSANDEAIRYWTELEGLLEPNSPDRKEVRALIASVGGTLKPMPETPAATPPKNTPAETQTAASIGQAITVKVSLSDAMKAKVKPDMTVFIYAKALSGSPMPLAVAKKQVKDLPLEIQLDDSMAMMPQMKLSNFPQVKVGARISQSGTPMPQAGDLFAEQSPVKAGDRVELEINQFVVN